MVEYDPGPSPVIADIFSQLPDYSVHKAAFWYDWGPVLYRGRLDKSARLLCVGSDPGPTERVALRTLVGDAGQRVQGFLAKLGLTRSYLCLNALAYSLKRSGEATGKALIADPTHVAWRNGLFDQSTGPALQAIVAFGVHAQSAVHLWPGKGQTPVFNIPHPSSHDETILVNAWRDAITQLRTIVTPDGPPKPGNYGSAVVEADYEPIPRHDLPFGLPDWFGDDAWGRAAQPHHQDSVSRPHPDDSHTLIWIAPKS